MEWHTDLFHIYKAEPGEIPDVSGSAADYVICQSDVLDTMREEKLNGMGFRFLDRVFYFEIPLRSSAGSGDNAPIQEIEFSCSREIDDRVYELACQAYTSDRRFHLDPVFHQERANQVIRAYIEEFKTKRLKICKAMHGSELLGFTIVDETVDPRGKFFENVLGATMPGIRGKMIAYPLYRYMLEAEKEKFVKYVGRVSSSNAASINLHFQLGGSVKNIYDEFVYRK